MNPPDGRHDASPSGSAAYRDLYTLTGLALLINFIHLGANSIELDESTSIGIARHSFASLIPVLAGVDPNMGLYYVLLSCWVKIFGEGEAAVRSLSAIFGALAVSVIYLLGRHMFGRAAGVVAGLLLASDTFVVQYAQTARSYALLLFLILLSSYFLVVDLDGPTRRREIAFVVASALAVYAHYFALYIIVVQLGTVLAIRRRRALSREWFLIAAAILVLCAPEAIFAYRAGASRLAWIQPPSWNDIYAVFVEFTGGSRLTLFALVAGGLYAAVSAPRDRRHWQHGFVAAWMIVPVALSFAVSSALPMFISYYLIISVPGLILFGAAAIERVRYPQAAAMVMAPLLLLSAIHLVDFYSRERGECWRDATRYVLEATRPDDGVIFYPDYAHKPFDYYRRRRGVIGPLNLPRQMFLGPNRIWLVIRESDAAAHITDLVELRSALTVQYHPVNERRFRRVGVELYEHRFAAGANPTARP